MATVRNRNITDHVFIHAQEERGAEGGRRRRRKRPYLHHLLKQHGQLEKCLNTGTHGIQLLVPMENIYITNSLICFFYQAE